MMKYDGKNNGVHYCEYTDDEVKKTYYFYMKGKVCENCFEMDAVVFLLVIVMDIIGTAFVMMVIYKCTKRKSSAGSKSSYKTPSRSGGPAPPTPSRDYETLNAHTRTQDTYSTVNRTG
ncbi:T-cell surface glycoprotein CD3 epsilon chain Precursor [Channa argus]|uniref:T-cell surface glycoprotein CD3 epsilon chain n=2 Tax=Channa argus TaxID=215402 RepID=A0A6G1PS37_CHAAH|nr:T-cell surface glycoprotein CD3 epsilon chain Precursor [Channa argus]